MRDYKQSRNYTGRIVTSKETTRLLEENFANWQNFYAVGYDRILTLCGAYFPIGENAPETTSLTSGFLTSPKKGKKSKKEEIEKPFFENSLDVICATIVTFLNWLPAEELTDLNSHLVVPTTEVVNKFREMWKEDEVRDSVKILVQLCKGKS